MKLVPLAFILAVCAGSAQAQEIITAGASGAPPAAEAGLPAPMATEPAPRRDGDSPEAIGAWANGVIAGEPSQTDAAPGRLAGARCPPREDRKPHGQVWAGIGTRGYRNVGAVVNQPVGDCGEVTVAIEHTEFNGGQRRRGRR